MKPKPNITKTQKFHKTLPVLACSRQEVKKNCAFLRFHILWKFNYRRKTCEAKRSLSFTA